IRGDLSASFSLFLSPKKEDSFSRVLSLERAQAAHPSLGIPHPSQTTDKAFPILNSLLLLHNLLPSSSNQLANPIANCILSRLVSRLLQERNQGRASSALQAFCAGCLDTVQASLNLCAL